MKILFIGGNGNISWWCTEAALRSGYETYELNRGKSSKTRRAVQNGVTLIHEDIHDVNRIKESFSDFHFDCICDFICRNEVDAEERYDIFQDKCDQYIYISSDSVFKREAVQTSLVTEESQKNAPEESSDYIRGKLNAEKYFISKFKEAGFPITIVRPAYTYDTIMPSPLGNNCFTECTWLLKGYPILVPGNGNNRFAFTHSIDFADAFITLVGNKETIGEDYNIIGDEYRSLNEEANIILDSLGINNHKIIHIPVADFDNFNFYQAKDLMLQRTNNYCYDNSKIKRIADHWKTHVDLELGVKLTVSWLMEQDIRRRIVPKVNEMLRDLYNKYL